MAEVIEWKNYEKPMRALQYNNLAVAVPAAGNTTIATIPVLGLRRLFVDLLNTGFAFDVFNVDARFVPGGAWVNLYTLAADYTSPRGVLVGASGDLTILPSGATHGWLLLDTPGIEAFRFQASANGGATSVDVYASGS